MTIKTTPDKFANDLLKMMQTYTDDVVDGIEREVRDTALTSCEKLQNIRMPEATTSGSAKPMKRRQWNRYSKSWIMEERKGNNYFHTTIRNRKHYRLTHLLERGHMTRNGEKTRAFEHIKPVEEDAVSRIEKSIPEIIKKGGR